MSVTAKKFSEIAKVILKFVRENQIPFMMKQPEKVICGIFILRCGQYSGEVMVCFIVRTPIRPKLEPLVQILTAQFPDIRCICMNCNPKKTNVILGGSNGDAVGK